MYIQPDSTVNKIALLGLNALSLIYKTVALLNLWIKSLMSRKFPAIIISVDNLSYGGTGKTPMVIEIAKFLQSRGIKFAIVLRGYRSRYQKEGTLVSSSHSVNDVGDEAKMYQKRFPGNDVLVGKDRSASLKKAVERQNRVIILDDGFQSSHIQKDLAIMLVNRNHPFYYLRHFPFLKKRDDIVLVYDGDCDGSDPACYSFEMEGFFNAGGEKMDPAGDSLFGFSAVGDNHRFQKDLRKFNLKKFLGFKDHHRFTEDELLFLNRQRIEAEIDWLVCTEKDLMKISEMKIPHIPLIYVRNRIKCNQSFLQRLDIDAAKKSHIETPD